MFNLTRQEQQVILFLMTVVLVGTGINFLAKRFSTVKVLGCFSQEIGKINLNTADKDLLKTVSGIGEKLAQRIINYREEKARFADVQGLRNIKGITTARFEKIKDLFYVK